MRYVIYVIFYEQLNDDDEMRCRLLVKPTQLLLETE